VTFHRAKARTELSDLPEAVRALEAATTIEAQGWAVIVDDNPIVALPTKEDAEKTLEMVKSFYERKVKNLDGKPTFKENVFVDKRHVLIRDLRSAPEDAVSALTTTSEKPTVHAVKRGDRAVNIARHYGVSLAQLKSLNPGVDPDRLTEGDLLTIQLPKLPVTVICKSIVTETVNISPPSGVRSGRTGTRVTKVLVTYENGQRTSGEIVSQVTTWDKPTSTKRR